MNLVDEKSHVYRTKYSVRAGYPNSASEKSPQSPHPYMCAVTKKSGDISVNKHSKAVT
jgi:hypothetical protein